MKKLICVLMSLLMIFWCTSCINITIEGPENDGLNTESTNVLGENQTSPDPTPNQPGSDNDDTKIPPNVNNGVLKEVSPEAMDVPENMKWLGTESATEENNSVVVEATAVIYSLDGSVVNWATENDYIYIITTGNNRLVMIDSRTMCPVYNTPLSGMPAEMNIVGDKIYISFPDLCRIDVFSKDNCEKQGSLYFDHEVSSFCLDGDYIYYTEHDQFCKVFKKNLTTNNLTMIQSANNGLFYYPKIYLNQEDRILYVGESKSSGSALYYFDADTLALKSVFKKNDYGIMNHTREIFHIGDEIFWGDYRLSDTNAKELAGKYGTNSYGSTVFASEELVSTYEGLFLTDTYECVIDYFEAGFQFKHLIFTESYNLFFRKSDGDQNIIIGLNFAIQDELKMQGDAETI